MRKKMKGIVSLSLAFTLHVFLFSIHCYADELTTITSETLEYDQQTETYIAKGKVRIQRADTVIEADDMTYNEKTGDVVAAGNVKYDDPDVSMTAGRADLNLDSKTGRIYDAAILYKKDNYHISGREIHKRGEKYYYSPEAAFTTCDAPLPAWCFKGKEVNAALGESLKAKGVSFRVKGIPVLYTPYLRAPILTERKTGLLMPVIGYSDSRGLHMNIPFFWAISENHDATFILDEYTERGLGQGIEYRYLGLGGIKGRWWLYHIRDSELRKDFVELRALHEQRSSEDIGGFLSINLLNEKEFYREFDTNIGIRTNRFLESTGEITMPFSNSRAYLLSQYWIDLKEDSQDPAQRLPEAGFVLNPSKIGYFWVSAETAFSNFWSDEGIYGQRFDIFPRISHKFGTDIVISQTLALRETAYALKRSEENSPHREALEYGIIGHTRLLKQYGFFTHVIEPSLSYTLVTSSENSLSVFDSTELYQKTSLIELSLLNRILYKNGELLVLRLSQGFDSYDGDRPFQPLLLEVGLKRPLSLRLGAAYDVHTGQIENIYSDLSANIFGTVVSVGQRYNRPEDIQTYVAGIVLHPYKPLFMDGSIWYDAEKQETRDIAFNIKYMSQCWGVNVGFVKSPDDFSVKFLFELKGLTKALKI
jgi:LPS-assembly protein